MNRNSFTDVVLMAFNLGWNNGVTVGDIRERGFCGNKIGVTIMVDSDTMDAEEIATRIMVAIEDAFGRSFDARGRIEDGECSAEIGCIYTIGKATHASYSIYVPTEWMEKF